MVTDTGLMLWGWDYSIRMCNGVEADYRVWVLRLRF